MAQQQQRYRIIEKIAAGGMAEVYRAESAGLEGFKKLVAIKRVLPHLAEKKKFMGMFLDEARLSAHLSHSNCVQVFDIGVGDNTYFIVMEYVDGADLKALVEYSRNANEPITVEIATYICLKICEGLAYAHNLRDEQGQALGIVHRDMSPPNVLITRYGEIKIVDFGLAKANSQLEKSEPGIIKGKFSYLAPEAATGGSVDHRVDIFAVGIILWEILAGRRLFMGETDLETVRQVQAAKIPSLRQFNPYVPPELEQVLAKSLAKNPADRYGSADDLAHDLSRFLYSYGRPVSALDVGRLVQQADADRATRRHREQTSKGSIIGELIDQAMVEFTSLDDGAGGVDGGDGSQVGATPLNLGAFGGVDDWATQLGGGDALDSDEGMRASLPAGPVAGNLAALEDDRPPSMRGGVPSAPSIPDAESAPRQSVPEQPAPQQSAPPQASSPMHVAPPPAPPEVQSSGGGKGAIVAILLVLALVAGGAGAYFGGLIP